MSQIMQFWQISKATPQSDNVDNVLDRNHQFCDSMPCHSGDEENWKHNFQMGGCFSTKSLAAKPIKLEKPP